MFNRKLMVLALASVAFAGACSDDSDTVTPTNLATVRFVNATAGDNITITNNGITDQNNTALAFGGGSTCLDVNTVNPSLAFTNAATGATIGTFAPAFTTNGNYTVVAYTAADGSTQFATLDNSFTPVSGQSGLRIFNAANGSGNVEVLSNGVVVGTNGAVVGFPTSSTFMSVPTGAQVFSFDTGTGTTAFGTTNSVTLDAGQNSTVILGPAIAGTTNMRAFVTTGC